MLAGWSVRRLTIDVDARSYEIETTDGVVHRQEMARPGKDPTPELPRDFRRVSYDTAERTLTLLPPNGDPLVVEVFDGGDQSQRRAGRPVVYLDQNKWVLLGRAIHSPSKVPPSELPAAKELIWHAEQQRVILPLSSGHYIETARVDRSWRQNLAPLMVRLSRGWLMRDPLLVRRAELRAMFRERVGAPVEPAVAVITLDPSQAYGKPIDVAPLGEPGWPKELRLLTETLAAVTATFAVLVEDEVTHSEAGYEVARRWAESHQPLAEELRTNTRARELPRDLTRMRFLTDLAPDLAEVAAASGMSMERFQVWCAKDAEGDLQKLPYLGRMRDVIHFRLRNAGDRWEPNDLVDMMYLPCAAAYADFVVAENKTRDYLLRAQRTRSDGALVVSSIAQLMERLALPSGTRPSA
jgi:hypothetical protein